MTAEEIDAVVSAVYLRCWTFSEMTGTISAENITLITQSQLWTHIHDSDDVVTIAGMVARILRRNRIKVVP